MKIGTSCNSSIKSENSFNNLIEYLPKSIVKTLGSQADELIHGNGTFTIKQSLTDNYNMVWGQLIYKSNDKNIPAKKSDYIYVGLLNKYGNIKLSKDIVNVASDRMKKLIQPPNIVSQIMSALFK